MNEKSYDDWHRKLADREDSESPDTASGTWYEMVRERLGSVKGLSVLEVGCGRGSFAIELAKRGARVTALDLSAAAVGIGRQRAEAAGADVCFVVADATQTGLPSSQFDLVVSCECLEHVDQPGLMAQELFRVCKHGGRCLLTTPSYLNGSLLAWLHSWILRRPYNSGEGVQPRENFFLFFLVRRMLRSAGFDVVDEESRIYQWLLLPRVAPETLRTESFRRPLLNRLARPFGLHFLFDLRRPVERSAGMSRS